MKHFIGLAFVAIQITAVGAPLDQKKLDLPYTINADVFATANELKSLRTGALLGTLKTEVEDAKEINKKLPADPATFIPWATNLANEEVLKNKERLAKMKFGEMPAKTEVVTTAATNPASSKLDEQKLVSCAKSALPLIKSYVGARQIKSTRDQAFYALQLSELSADHVASSEPIEALCQGWWGSLQLKIDIADQDDREAEWVLLLSMLARFEVLPFAVKQTILGTMSMNFQNDVAPISDFWKNYWNYLTIEILLRQNVAVLLPQQFGQSTEADMAKFEEFSKRLNLKEDLK